MFSNGKQFKSVEELVKHHERLIWFTYKKNCNISATINSDIGWGCMIRAAQMMMAEVLRRTFQEKGVTIDISYVISSFLESETNPKYSLSRFLNVASAMYMKNPGDWFSLTEIAFVLQEIQQSNPLKGT